MENESFQNHNINKCFNKTDADCVYEKCKLDTGNA